ncbi:glutaredoxin domain-containing protein [Arcanobacterium hippocoleae]
MEYKEINLEQNPQHVDLLKAMGYKTVPVVFAGINH